MAAFCLEIGYPDHRVSTWRDGEDRNGDFRPGKDPSIQHMRELADALGVPLGEILVAAAYGTPDDFGGVRPMERKLPDIDEAIKLDPRLSPGAKRALRAVREATRVTDDVEVRNRTGR